MGTTIDLEKLGEATIVCGNKFDVDTSGLVFDPATGQLDLRGPTFLSKTDDADCTNRAMASDELFLPYGDSVDELLQFWGYLIALGALFMVGTVFSIKRLDWK